MSRLDTITKRIMANYDRSHIVNNQGYHPLTGDVTSLLGMSGSGPFVRLTGRWTFEEIRQETIECLHTAMTSVYLTPAQQVEASAILREAGIDA